LSYTSVPFMLIPPENGRIVLREFSVESHGDIIT
jgi:hypothetical protein